ncbi:hypothetical protein J2045_002145 [Peteryoungia aggregata LMG 23059]|uniref:Ribbon-helix-helix protein CopG domain-containing protein n=1 Tax=Peteryoungia aggregata LMG 23059 TaxID=1368425 RepID=A0ABU0G7M6_9HYPH|nr:hypothetical protein [Peteryoungia aggregata]MDQ0421118.1 hypothetical protein [Peteryoungia aggregata LMG 23059]
MSLPPINVRIDPRRLEQLKAIGAALNLSNAGVISELIREKIRLGLIPDDIPGITVQRQRDEVRVSISPGKEVSFSLVGARVLARTIRGVVDGTEAAHTINMDHDFDVSRQGTGIRISIPFASGPTPFPPDLAEDFAALIEKAAQ